MPSRIVFVCSGNTCRSPMAAELFTWHIQRAKTIQADQFVVASAGTDAMPGQPAAPSAVRVLQEKGIEPKPHRSAAFDESHAGADLILTMTESHKNQLLFRYPQVADKVFTLKEYAGYVHDLDIVDPYMQGDDAYRAALRDIEAAIVEMIRRLTESDDSV